METQKNQLAKFSPGFIENSLETLEKSMEYAQRLLDSKLCPSHFYEKKSTGEIDYTKGNPAAVLMVIQHGLELGLSVSQSLQQVVPINGLLTLKGDASKALILSSGVCEKWEETITGKIEDGTYEVKIYAKRKNGEEMTSVFNLGMAERAGLWYRDINAIKNEKVRNAYYYSPWRKYTERMCHYRPLGYISRDLFGDVTGGFPIAEEAQDYDIDGMVTIQTKTGQKIKISESKLNQLTQQSESLSQSITEKIDNANQEIETEEKSESAVSESHPEGKSGKTYTEKELFTMGVNVTALAEKILPAVKHTILKNLQEPKRKMPKFWRDAILMYQEGTLDKFLDEEIKKESGGGTHGESAEEENKSPESAESDPAEEIKGNEDLKPNKNFEKEKDQGSGPAGESDLEISEIGVGNEERDTIEVYSIYEAILKNTKGESDEEKLSIVNKVIEEKYKGKFKELEDFCIHAPKIEILNLLG
jgi:hypothetical protein